MWGIALELSDRTVQYRESRKKGEVRTNKGRERVE